MKLTHVLFARKEMREQPVMVGVYTSSSKAEQVAQEAWSQGLYTRIVTVEQNFNAIITPGIGTWTRNNHHIIAMQKGVIS